MNQTRSQKNNNLIQVLMFTLFSISAGIIQVVCFTLLFEVASWIYWPSYLIALILSVIWNFTLNRKFTFKAANNIPIAMIKVGLFYLIFTPVSTWLGNLLTNIGWNEYVILGLTMGTNLVLEFLYTKYFVYKHAINSAVKVN